MADYQATTGIDTLVGGAGNADDTFIFTSGTPNSGDTVNGRGGTDTLLAQGYGTTIDFRPIGAHFTAVEELKIQPGVTVDLDSGQLGGGTGKLPTNLIIDGSDVHTTADAPKLSITMLGGALNLSGLQFQHWDSAVSMVTITGTSGNDSIVGSNVADYISGGQGNDTIRGAGGDDIVDGGGGTDTFVVSAAYSDLHSAPGPFGPYWSITSADGTDKLRGIEIVDDGTHHTLLVGSGGFTTIQAAVDAAQNGDTIIIANGDYTEQVNLDGKGDITLKAETAGGVTIHAPTSVAQTGTDPQNGKAIHAVVTVHDSTGIVLDGLVVDGDSHANGIAVPGGDFVGVAYLDASGTVENVTVKDFRDPLVDPNTVSGNQRGTDILSSNTTGAPNSLEIAHSTIEDFQKTGIVARNTDVYFHDNTVHGFGPQTIIAQNGIQLSSGSSGEVSDNTIDGIGFVPNSNVVVGVLVFDSSDGLVVSGNHFTGTGVNDVGVYLSGSSNASVSGNSFDGHDYGVIDDSNAGLPNQVINTGVDANTYANIGELGFDHEPTAANPNPFDVHGTSFSDYLVGGAGNDTLVGHGGDDYLDGGAGTDTASYGAVTADDIKVTGGAWTVTAAGDGTDTLHNVEKVSDGTHNFLLVGADGYATIQAAIDAASNGDTILVAAGDYTLAAGLNIDKSISILGANHGLDGTDAARGDETVIHGPASGATLNIGAGHTITIDGVEIDANSIVNAGSAGDVFAINHSILNVTNAAVPNIYFGYAGGYDFTFSDNLVNSTGYSDGTIFLFEGGTGHVTGNTFSATGASATDHAVALNLNGISGEVTGNTFDQSDIGVLVAGTAHDLSIGGNTFDGLSRGDTAANGYAAGILLFDPHYTGTGVSISDNTFENSDAGIRTSSYNSGSVAGLPITIDGNDFSSNAVDVSASATGILHLTGNTIDTASVSSYYVGGPTADSITGTAGADLIEGNAGADTINPGLGDDTVDGGAGTDTLVLSAAPTSITYDSGTGAFTIVSADGTDVVKNLEVISAGGHNSYLVSQGGSIQAAIDAASAGDTILVAGGVYNEHVNVNKAGLTITGIGDVTVQGTLLSDNGIATGGLRAFGETHGGYNGNAGDGVKISADGVTLNNINVSGFLHAIDFAVDTANTTLTNVDLATNIIGIEKATTADINGLTITGGSISDGYLGIDFAKATGIGNEADGVATNVDIGGTSFTGLDAKGIYVETLTDSTIHDITMNDVGQFGGWQSFGAFGNTGNAINVNLKAGTYQNITIEDFHLTDTGASDQRGAGAIGANSGAIVVEARDDGGTYGPAPAVVTDAVVIKDGTIDGHTSTGIRIGEPTKNNADPDVNVSNVTISGASHATAQGEVNNQTQSVLSVTGTSGVDSVATASTTTGAVVFKGGAGSDNFTGHGEFDAALFDATLTKSSFAFNGTSWTVNAGATEGTDTLTGVEEVTDGAGHHFFLVGSGGYGSIQAAVNAAADGDTILVASGSFTENVTITKGLSIYGAKSGIDGAGAGRGVGDGSGETTLEGRITINTAHDVTLDGFRFLDSAASGINGAAAPAVYVTTAGTSGAGHQIVNSVFYSTVAGGDTANQDDRGVFVAGSSAGQVTVAHDYFTGSTLGQYGTAAWGRGIWSDGGTQTLDIENNTFQSVRSGVNLDGYNDATSNVSNNSFILAGTAYSIGVNTTSTTFTGIHDNLYQVSDTDFNFNHVTTPISIDLTATNNTSSPGQITEFESGSGGDTIKGSAGADIILGNAGNDHIAGGGGDDTLDGGADTDTAVYSQTITPGMLHFNSDGSVTVTTGGAEGTDTLYNFEYVTDGTHTYSLVGGNSPVQFTSTPASQGVTEDMAVVSGKLVANTSASFSDLDPSDTHTVAGTIGVTSSNAHAGTVAAGLVAGTDYSLTATVDEAGHTVGYSWSVSNAKVQGLATGETITLTAHETISDASTSDNQDVVLVITGANDAPMVTGPVSLGSTLEDNAITVSKTQLLANATDVDGDALSVGGLTVTVAGTGLVTDNGDGTITITPHANYSGPVTLGYYVSDGTDMVATSAALGVTPVSDTPTLSVSPASGNEAAQIPLTITSALTDTDGSETLSIGITGVPSGATLSAGTNNGGGSWTLTQAQLSGLKLVTPANLNGDVTLHVIATATDGPATPAAIEHDLAVHINPGTGGIVTASDALIVTRGVASELSMAALTGNDTGGVGALSVASVSNATGGTVAIVNGKIAVNASAASGGFDYQATDTAGHLQNGHATFTSLVATTGADTLRGMTAQGADLVGGDGNDTLNASSTGISHLVGGAGDDAYQVYNSNDVVVEGLNGGFDRVVAFCSYTLSDNIENLSLQGGDLNGTGNDLDNNLFGTAGNNIMSGGAGNDFVGGGAGNDIIIGGPGYDQLSGGTGADTFVFNGVGDFVTGLADRIIDFNRTEADKIDLSNFDADSTTAGVQGFNFIGTLPFDHHAGELRYTITNGAATVQGDVNGDGVADFAIFVGGQSAMYASDFLFHV